MYPKDLEIDVLRPDVCGKRESKLFIDVSEGSGVLVGVHRSLNPYQCSKVTRKNTGRERNEGRKGRDSRDQFARKPTRHSDSKEAEQSATPHSFISLS